MSEYNNAQWMKYMRRHEANVFNAIFYDKEEVTEDDIQRIIADVATFFDLPIPEINGKCESFAEVLLDDKAGECELSYNLEMLRTAGINNKDAFTCVSFMRWLTKPFIGTNLCFFAVNAGCRSWPQI